MTTRCTRVPIDSATAWRSSWRGVVVVSLLGALWTWTDPAQRLDLHALDLNFAVAALVRAPSPADEIVVVALDEATLRDWPEPLALMHKHLGALLEILAAHGARAVALDIVLPERSYDGIAPGYDLALIRGILAMRAVGPLVLARTVDDGGEERLIFAPFVSAAGPGGSGFALLPLDRDGTVRRFDERLGPGGKEMPTLVGELARRLGLEARPGLIDFTRPVAIAPISMRTALGWAQAEDFGALRSAFGNKIVFVGALLPFTDQHRVPIALTDQIAAVATPGTYVHAQALRTLLGEDTIIELPALAAVLAAALCAVVWRLSLSGRAAAVSVIASFGLLALVGQGSLLAGYFVPVGSPLAALVVCAAMRLAIEVGAEVLARRRLRAAFAGYVSPAVMAELEAGRLKGLESKRAHVCVLFLDIRDFTARTETETPERVIAMLRILFEATTEVIHEHGGTVKEFMGDGVMAFFGAPLAMDNPEQAAFDAARALLAALFRVNESLTTSSHEPIEIGIGLDSGEAVVGNVGAFSRHAYGAVGDCVNLASRLEGLTKVLGYPLLMTDRVLSKLSDARTVAALGHQAIKGHLAVQVFGWK